LAEERKEVTDITGQTILVRSLKHDGSDHRSWTAHVIRHEGSLLVLEGSFDKEIEHELLGTIPLGTISIEYYWLDRWYNIFRFLGAGRVLRNFYCNVNEPPSLEGGVLSYIDLDIDILVEGDLSFRVLDLDEFEANARRYHYSPALQVNALAAVNQLINLIKRRAFPFDH
jgi:protein associated with RNAse G/E